MARKKKRKPLFISTINIEWGLQDCSKCDYKLRCDECVYNGKRMEEIERDVAQKFYGEVCDLILFHKGRIDMPDLDDIADRYGCGGSK